MRRDGVGATNACARRHFFRPERRFERAPHAAPHTPPRSGALEKNRPLLEGLGAFSIKKIGVGVFYGKNQSCSPCRETPRTGGDYADYDSIQVYSTPQDEALPWERTCRRPSCGVATRSLRRVRATPVCARNLHAEYVFKVFKTRLIKSANTRIQIRPRLRVNLNSWSYFTSYLTSQHNPL